MLALALAGCEHLDDKPSHTAGWTLLEPSQRHPILVSQQPHGMSLQVARGQHGLSPSQRAQLYSFLEKYRAMDGGNSKLVISVPAGSANEVAAMHAVADMRPMLAEHGFAEAAVSIEPYHADGDHQPPIRSPTCATTRKRRSAVVGRTTSPSQRAQHQLPQLRLRPAAQPRGA